MNNKIILSFKMKRKNKSIRLSRFAIQFAYCFFPVYGTGKIYIYIFDGDNLRK